MELFRKRPIAISALLFIVIYFVVFYTNKSIAIVLASAFILAFLLVAIFVKSQRVISVLFLITTFLSFTASYHYRFDLMELSNSFENETVSVSGYVLENRSYTTYASSYFVRLTSVNGEKKNSKILLTCDYASVLQPGDILTANVTGISWDTKDETEIQWLKSDGCVAIFQSEQSTDVEICGKTSALEYQLSSLNQQLTYRLVSALGKEKGGLASALLLGNKTFLSSTIKTAFSRIGISHILALSGLHITTLLLILNTILGFAKVGKKVRIYVIPFIAVAYLFMTGASFSTSRAVLMMLVLYISYFTRKRYDAFTTLCVALEIILLITPYGIYDVGLWMSFGATAGIIAFAPALNKMMAYWRGHTYLSPDVFKLISTAVSGLIIGLFASFLILPLSAVSYGTISILSIPMTVLSSLYLPICIVFSVLTLIFPFLSTLTSIIFTPLLEGAFALSEFPSVMISLNGIPQTIVLCVSFALICFLLLYKVKKNGIIIGALLGSVILLYCSALFSTFVLHSDSSVQYVTWKTGDILVFSKQGHAVAINTTDGKSTPAYTLYEMLQNEEVTELDQLVMLHYHNMDSNFLYTLFSKIKVGTVSFPSPENESESSILMRLTEVAEECHVSVTVGNEEIKLSDYEIVCNERYTFSSRHDAFLLSITNESNTYLYTNGSILKAKNDVVQETISLADYVFIGKVGSSTTDNIQLNITDNTTVLISDLNICGNLNGNYKKGFCTYGSIYKIK